MSLRAAGGERRSAWLAWAVQVLLVLAVVAGAFWVVHHALEVLRARGVRSGFDFLSEPAGFAISEGWLDFEASQPSWRAFLAGLVNTVRAAVPAVVFSVLLGTLIMLATLNHLGVTLFGCGLVALMLSYPRLRCRPAWIAAPFVIFMLWWLADVLRLAPDQVGARQVGALQAGALQVGAGEVGTAQVLPGEVQAGEHEIRERCPRTAVLAAADPDKRLGLKEPQRLARHRLLEDQRLERLRDGRGPDHLVLDPVPQLALVHVGRREQRRGAGARQQLAEIAQPIVAARQSCGRALA